MRVRVLHFGPLRERRGVGEEWIDCDPGLSLSGLYARMFGGSPEAALPVAFARNEAWAPGHEPIADGDEVAFIPPVGGG